MKRFVLFKKILVIIFLFKNLDIKFYDCLLNALKPIYLNNRNKITQELDDPYKIKLNSFIFSFLFIYINLLNTDILYKDYKHLLTPLNQKTSIFNINRRKFSTFSPKFLNNELEFQLQKELYYTRQTRQKVFHNETILSLENFNNIKYL